jgi:hypothetical protein
LSQIIFTFVQLHSKKCHEQNFVPVNVVSEIVVAAVHNEAAHGDAEREKHLAGCGTPDLWVEIFVSALSHARVNHNCTRKESSHLYVQELAPSGQNEE